MSRLVLSLPAVLIFAGCATALPTLRVPTEEERGLAAQTQPQPPVDETGCEQLSDTHRALAIATPLTAIAAGIGGIGSLSVQDPNVSTGMIIGAAVLSGVALVTEIAERSVLTSWQVHCIPASLLVPVAVDEAPPAPTRSAALLPTDAPLRTPGLAAR